LFTQTVANQQHVVTDNQKVNTLSHG